MQQQTAPYWDALTPEARAKALQQLQERVPVTFLREPRDPGFRDLVHRSGRIERPALSDPLETQEVVLYVVLGMIVASMLWATLYVWA